MKTALIISFIIFCIYLISTLLNPKIKPTPTSISETYYRLQNNWKIGFLFVLLFIFVIPFGMLPYFMEVTPSLFQCLGFLMGIGIMFVGAAPMFKDHENIIHTSGAVVAAVCSLLWAVFMGYWWVWLPYILIFTIMGLNKKIIKTHATLLGELVAFLSTYTILLLL